MMENGKKSLRYKIGLWFTLVWGIALACLQGYKYFTNTLNEPYEIELVVSVFALFMVLAPIALLVNLKNKFNDK